MAESPSYRPRVKIGSLRQTTKKMMVTKTSGGKVGDDTMKKFLKEDKGLRRMAYGDQKSTVESWKGRHFMKGVKEKIEGSSEVRESFYGKKSSGEKAFRDSVKEEVRQDQAAAPQGPTKDEQLQKRRMDKARSNLRKFEQAREIESETGKSLKHKIGADPNAPSAGNDRRPPTSQPRSLKLAGGGLASATTQAPTDNALTVVASSAATRNGPERTSLGLPSVFGLRGRVLRVDPIKQTILVRVLNAPPELSIFIGRDRSVKVPPGTRCWKDRHTIACVDILVGELIDSRGKVLNSEFLADELYVNGGELPDFVVHLGRTEPSVDLPTAAPDDLVIG